MEYFLYSLGASWLWWIAIIAIVIYTKRTRTRVRELSARLDKIEKAGVKPSPVGTESQNAAMAQTEGKVPDEWAESEKVAESINKGEDYGKEGAFSAWIKENWLIKAGALLFILAVTWFVNYAFLHNWIGPVGRITLGLLLGVVLLVLGVWRMRNYVKQGSVFLVLGSSTILLTTFAARAVYGFFTPESSLALMLATVVFVAYISVLYRARPLAIFSMLMAYLTPLLTAASALNEVFLFTYLLVIAIGSVGVASITGWRILTPAAIVLTAFYSTPYFMGSGGDVRYTLLMFSYVFTALFFVTGTLSAIHYKQDSDDEGPVDIYTPVLNGIFLLLWILSVVPQVWQSLTLCAWMIVFVAAAFMIFRKTSNRNIFYAYAAVGIAYLAAATAAELSGYTLTIAYTVEVGALVIISRLALRSPETAEALSWLFFVPGFMTLPSVVSSAWQGSPINQDFFVLLMFGVTITLVGVVLKSAYLDEGKQNSALGKACIIIGTIYAYALIWLVSHANLFADGLATGISLGIYTIAGIGTYLYGQNNARKDIVTYGSILIGVVIGRLLLVDVWSLELVWRIVVFALVGVLLMSTAFLGRKKN